MASINYLCTRNKGFILAHPSLFIFSINRPPRTADPTDPASLSPPTTASPLTAVLGSYHKLIANNRFPTSLPPILYKPSSLQNLSLRCQSPLKCPDPAAGLYLHTQVVICLGHCKQMYSIWFQDSLIIGEIFT